MHSDDPAASTGMSGWRRVAVAIGVCWTMMCLWLSFSEPDDIGLKLIRGVFFGGAPWGVWWVLRGFKYRWAVVKTFLGLVALAGVVLYLVPLRREHDSQAELEASHHLFASAEAPAISSAKPTQPTTASAAQSKSATPFEAHFAEAAQLYSLPKAFILAIAKVQSDFVPDAISDDGAAGLMGLKPDVAREMGVLNMFDPRQNVLGGARQLRILANRFNGDLVLTIAAYKAGEDAVERYHGVLPDRAARRYVQAVLHQYYLFRDGSAPKAGPSLPSM